MAAASAAVSLVVSSTCASVEFVSGIDQVSEDHGVGGVFENGARWDACELGEMQSVEWRIVSDLVVTNCQVTN